MAFSPKRTITLLALASAAFSARPAAAHDFVKESIPHKWIEPFLPEDLPAQKYPAYFDDVDKAKAQVHGGRYKTALITLRKVKDPTPAQQVAIALVKGRALAALGRTSEALEALSDAQAAPGQTPEATVPTAPRVQLLRAEVLASAGRPTEAIAALKEHLVAYPDSLGGHYLLGVAYEQVGDTDNAKAQYKWFVEEPRDYLGKWTARASEPAFESAENVTWLGRAVDRWATLHEQYRGNNALPKTVLNIFVKARQIDAEYWPANVAAAEYFLARDENEQAVGELKAALASNPQDPAALRLMAEVGLQTFNFDQVDAVTDALRAANPASVAADLIEARNLLLQRLPKDAEEPVRRVLAQQPKNIEALGLQAAVYALQLQEEKVDEVLKQVDAIDVGHDNASAYFEVAEQLSAMRQYPRAAARYEVAIARAPWWTAARNGLGLLYTQSGDEDKAHLTLDQAHALDPFNAATTNYLRLLDTMLAYKRIQTPHFVLIFDEKQDPLLGEYLPEFLESIHGEVSSAFKHEPAVKTFIEVFPSHDAFSVRTTGSPWIGTVGASTGRVIALVSPRKGGSNMEPFNWAQVLRHEYAHTVTLGATDNRIQHWMTEGLAVYIENTPVRWEWVPMLYAAVKKQKGMELFTMENLTWGFVRPKKPVDRQLAYAQSWWICQYIEETYGHEAILKMLAMFKDAGRQEDVFPAVTGKPMSSFYADFLVWCNKQVDGWGYDEETSKKYKTLLEQAEAATKARQYDEAIARWSEIVKIRPVDARPHERLAGLYLVQKKYDKAIEHLDRLHQVELKDNRFAKQIAKIYRSQKRWPDAEKYGMQAIYVNPYDLSAHVLLKEIHEASGNQKGLEREERVIPILTRFLEDQRRGGSAKPQDNPPAE